jgi:hypothetical protein
MNKLDFELLRNDNDNENGHDDYWFKVKGDSLEELDKDYMETGMVGVSEIVYSKDEDVVGIKRLFHFSWDVILVNNKELKGILKELS